MVILVDVDETVALVHLASPGRNQVDWPPWQVAHQVNAVDRNCLFHFANVFLQVVNPVWVMNLAVFDLVVGPQAVFNDEEGRW